MWQSLGKVQGAKEYIGECLPQPWGGWGGFLENVISKTDKCQVNISANGGGDEKTRREEQG